MTGNFFQRFTKRYIFILLLRFSPYIIYHFLISPYRKNVTGINYKSAANVRKQKRRIRAIQHAILNILLNGYRELMQEKILPSSGQMLWMLFELTISLDEYLDKNRKTNKSLQIKDVIEDPRIKDQIKDFRDFLRLFGREEFITSHLRDMFSAHYDHYINLIRKNVGQESFDEILEISQLDSGRSISSAMEVVRLFNLHKPNKDMLDEFYFLGTLFKFAEDIIDLAFDVENGHLNLFYSLAKLYPDERINLELSIKNKHSIDLNWLNKNCCKTFGGYSSLMESYCGELKSPTLKFAGDLSIASIFLGDYIRNNMHEFKNLPRNENQALNPSFYN